MRTIDILISAASEVQKESAIAEHLICSLAAEFDLAVSISYSNRLRGAKEDAGFERNDPEDESTPVVRPFFWDHPVLERDNLPEQDQTQYDLVICLVWSRLASVPVGKCVLANGSPLSSPTNYEIDSILDQPQRAFEVQRFRVYRNRAIPDFLLEPKEEREEMCRQWDAVQDFFARWEKDNEIQFRECCQEYLDLEEFANLFRQHFRNFLVEQLGGRIDPKKAPVQNRIRAPFRGLNFFDFEDAAFYYGRTRAIGEVLDALKKQATAKKSLVLILGPSGSGKSSLVRAGVLPLLSQGGTPVGDGPWRRAITRPSVGDPIDTLAAALVAKFALPELQAVADADESLSLTSRLTQDPENAAAWIAEVLEKSKMRLALVVDQLEELFIGVSPVLQRKYVTALCALARRKGIYVVAALRSEFYAHYQRFPELVKLTSGCGRYELQPPTAREIANMIRLPAETAGLRFERDSETGRSLDDFLLKAATSSSSALPLLEHVLSRLYNRQLGRNDGLLRWSDYCELGRFRNALAQHADFAFLTLNRDEQHAFKFMIRQLLALGGSKESVLVRRPVPYHDLVSSPKLNHRQSAMARGVIDRLINEGLLSADTDSKQCRLISLPQDALLHNWPRLLQSLSEDQHFFGMRDRLDESIRLWLSRGSQSDGLLHDRIALAEGETLLRDFGPALSESQIAYIQKSLAKQKRPGGPRKYVLPAAIAGFAALAVMVVAERFNSANHGSQTSDAKSTQPDKSPAAEDTATVEARLKEAEEKVALAKQNAELADRQRTALEAELKTAEDKLSQLEDVELTDDKRRALQSKLKEAEDKVKQVRAKSDETSSQLSALQVQLKEEQNKAQRAQATADSLTSEHDALQNQLKQAEANALAAQQKADIVTSQRSALETQLKDTEEKLTQSQANSGGAAGQLSALQAQLKQEQEKEQKAQASADSLTSERNALQSQLKASEEKLKLAQTNSGDAASQLSALQAQLKQEQEKEQKAQANAESLTGERNALQSQLKQAETKALAAQQNADLVSGQRTGLQTQLKDAQEKLKQVEANSGSAAGQLSALQAELKQEQEKEQRAQASADSLTSERNALQNQLKASEEKLKLAQTNSGDAASQLSSLQAQLKEELEKEQEAQASADSLISERNALQSQLKAGEEKLKLAQTNSGDATSQLSSLQAQLKQEQEKEQRAQASADSLTSERNALQSQLKASEEKLKLAQTNSGDAASQLSSLQTQLKQEQEKKQKAQASADSLTSAQHVLQNQVKEAEAKALTAQQNADLASSQRNALETRLKDVEEKLKQTQSNSGDGASQVSALQTELKQEQQKEQKAQANNDSLTSERALLQTQLRQAESKALLAQEGAALAASERSALETQLKEAEEKLKQAQLNSGDTSNQLSALRTQLKQEQEKGKKAQANADSLTGERNALQSQVKQAETKALLAQQSADLASSQRGALEAQLKDAQEKLKQVNASSGDKLGNLQARLYAARPGSTMPLPPINASGTATPTESQSSQNSDTANSEESLKEFVLGYLRTVASNDTSAQRRYFADQVNFFGRGMVDASTVEATTEEYHREWPIRQWTPRGQATIVRSRHRNRFVVYQPFRWAVSDGSRNDQGNATLYLMIRRDSQGEFRIVHVHQIDR